MSSLLWAILIVCVLQGGRGGEANYDDLEIYLREHFVKDLESPVPRWWSWRMSNSSSGPWMSMYLPSPQSNSTSNACKEDLRHMALALQKPETDWPLQMVDSWGKLPDGIRWGNVMAQGSFDQCLSIRYHSEEADIKGKYCSVIYARQNSQGARSKLLGRYDAALMVPRIALMSAAGDAYPLMGFLVYGTCIPSHCTQEDLKASIEDTIEGEITALTVTCQMDDQHVFDAADISFITVLALLLALLLSAAVIDIYIDLTDKHDWRTGPLKYFLVFSLSTNFRKLFHITEKSAPGTITCLHGIRVLSMCWVVSGHQIVMSALLTKNLFAIDQKTNGLMFQIYAHAHVSVDTFFFMSGLLVSYGVMRELKRTGRFNAVMFYVHRIIRLTPPIAMTVGLNATIIRFFARGPLYSDSTDTVSLCRKNGWKDILYVNNFLGFDEKDNWQDCLGQCWYTAVDTQLFLVAPLLLLPLHFYPVIGQGLLYLFSLASVLIPAIITVVHNYPPGSVMGLSNDITKPYFRYVYVTPWCRAGSWVVGIWTGYIIFKQGQKKLTMKPWQVVIGWTLAVFVSLATLFGLYDYSGFVERVEYGVMTQFFYAGFSRATWALAVAWVVFACHNGYGGIVNSFLSYPAWQPLSRLTYAMYLMAISIQVLLAYTAKSTLYFTHVNKMLETCGSLFVTGIASTLLSLSVESPILGLEKLIFRKPGPPAKKNIPDASQLHARL